MKLPVIRSVAEFVESNDAESVEKAVGVLEHLSQVRGMKEEEINVIGELISNLCGGMEVAKMVESGKPQREALNEFMQRVMGSIDK